MQTLLLDTCVILDIIDSQSNWHSWAKDQFRTLSKTHLPDFYIGTQAAVCK